MDSKSVRFVRGARVTPKRSEAEQRALNDEIRRSMNALAREAKAAGLTGRKVQQILREIEIERKAGRRAR